MLGVNILEAVTCISLCLFSSQNNKGAFKVFFFFFSITVKELVSYSHGQKEKNVKSLEAAQVFVMEWISVFFWLH